jgi:hypothetical protein
MRPQSDDYPDYIERAVRALVQEGPDAGERELQPIAYPPRVIEAKRAVSRSTSARIFKRDRFVCRYCNGKTILTPVMELLGVLYPKIFPFQSEGWKAGITHPAVIARSPAVDHVEPIAHGGSNDDENLATACWPCNAIKSDFTLELLGWTLRPISDGDWDGLTRYYRELWKAAGRPKDRYHENWMALLGL